MGGNKPTHPVTAEIKRREQRARLLGGLGLILSLLGEVVLLLGCLEVAIGEGSLGGLVEKGEEERDVGRVGEAQGAKGASGAPCATGSA